jgi:hypothetical protein
LRNISKVLEYEVTIVTALPNYPKNEIFPAYKGKYLVHEFIDEVSVYRTWIFVSASRGVVAPGC